MSQMICPFCKKSFPGDYKWCMEDGSELEQDIGQYIEGEEGSTNTVPCPDCDEPVDVRDIFCGSCGAKLTGRLPDYIPPANESADEYISSQSDASGYDVQSTEIEIDDSDAPGRDCPVCSARIALEDTFCGECGAKVEPITGPGFEGIISGSHCKGCSAGLEPGDEFCGVCGMPVESAAAAVKTSPAGAICSSCGATIASDDEFCGECGMKATGGAAQIDATTSGASCPGCGAPASADDVFCGECGFNLKGAQSASSPITPPPSTSPAAQTKSECPNCGMDIAPGDTLCNVCGFDLTQEVQRTADLGAPEEDYIPEPEPEPIEIIDPFGGKGMKPETKTCPSCGLQVPHGSKTCIMCGASVSKDASPDDDYTGQIEQQPATLSASACPNCGMDVGPDDTFCGTCGHSLSETAETPEIAIAEQPEPYEDTSHVASIADITSDIPVCPDCGVEGEHGAAICLACGTPLKPAKEIDSASGIAQADDFSAEPPSLSIEDASAGYVDEYAPAPEIETPAPVSDASAAQPSGGGSDVKICSCCGLECPSNAEFCAGCGVDFD